MYRLKDWDVIRKHKADLNFSGALDSNFEPATENEARYYISGFDDGADAYEQGLNDSAYLNGVIEYYADGSILFRPNKKGTLVFIPDE